MAALGKNQQPDWRTSPGGTQCL